MALTETQILKIARILNTPGQPVTYVDVYDNVTYYWATHITAQVETDVAAELVRWNAVADSFDDFAPTESNQGLVSRINREKNDIRSNLATLLYMTSLNFGAGRLIRG